jgi:predicted DNA-binding transcriptional regulator YafY
MSQQELEQAIKSKRVVEFSYSDHVRVIEPHILGISGGKLQILGYQIGGTSSSGGLPQWRRFDIDRMQRLTVTDQTFPGKRPETGKPSPWDKVLLIVE